ncbi:MAG TPA: hypothetical protein VMB85_00425 [Bryobacteraceae bacterium]|nr:hypothetical protein [Bryobacteraceae bacterium]
MKTRLIATLAGGLLGLALASQVNTSLDLGISPTLALAGCSLAGLAIGYVGSILFDVFARDSGEDRADS